MSHIDHIFPYIYIYITNPNLLTEVLRWQLTHFCCWTGSKINLSFDLHFQNFTIANIFSQYLYFLDLLFYIAYCFKREFGNIYVPCNNRNPELACWLFFLSSPHKCVQPKYLTICILCFVLLLFSKIYLTKIFETQITFKKAIFPVFYRCAFSHLCVLSFTLNALQSLRKYNMNLSLVTYTLLNEKNQPARVAPPD